MTSRSSALLIALMTGACCALEAAASELAATMLGEEVRSTDAAEMQAVILTRLFDQYAAERGIEAEPAQIDAFVENMRRGMEQIRACRDAPGV